jgi:hypothetical protein
MKLRISKGTAFKLHRDGFRTSLGCSFEQFVDAGIPRRIDLFHLWGMKRENTGIMGGR